MEVRKHRTGNRLCASVLWSPVLAAGHGSCLQCFKGTGVSMAVAFRVFDTGKIALVTPVEVENLEEGSGLLRCMLT